MNVTTVAPNGNDAGALLVTIGAGSTASVEVDPARNVVIAAVPGASTAVFPGAVTTGAIVSLTVTVAVAVPLLPDVSV